MIFGGDLMVARDLMDRALTRPGQSMPLFDPNNWIPYVDYAVVLQNTGETGAPDELVANSLT